MKILTVLTYYRPHTSGLTIYAERLACAFVQRGHQVTVMTTQYDPSLPRRKHGWREDHSSAGDVPVEQGRHRTDLWLGRNQTGRRP